MSGIRDRLKASHEETLSVMRGLHDESQTTISEFKESVEAELRKGDRKREQNHAEVTKQVEKLTSGLIVAGAAVGVAWAATKVWGYFWGGKTVEKQSVVVSQQQEIALLSKDADDQVATKEGKLMLEAPPSSEIERKAPVLGIDQDSIQSGPSTEATNTFSPSEAIELVEEDSTNNTSITLTDKAHSLDLIDDKEKFTSVVTELQVQLHIKEGSEVAVGA